MTRVLRNGSDGNTPDKATVLPHIGRTAPYPNGSSRQEDRARELTRDQS